MFRPLLLLAAILLGTSLHAASPQADLIFPDSTKGFVSFPNIKTFEEQWKQTQFGRLLDDPLMQDFKKDFQKQMNERMEKTFGLTFDSISSLPSGEVAFGMIAIPNQVPGYVLTMDVAEKRSETDDYLANLTKKLVASGTKKSTETYKGQQITILVFPPPEVPPAADKSRVETVSIERRAHYMFFQDVLVASDQLHLLKLIADRIADQGGKALATVEGYQVTMKRCLDDMPPGAPPSVRWYIEPLDYGESIRVLLRGPAAQNRRGKPSIFSILKEQGFDAIRGIGGTVGIKTEEQESVYRTFVYTQKPYKLAMQMLNFPDHTNFDPPVWMPADLARCTMIYVDPVTIFDNFGALFDALVVDEEGVWADILDGLENDKHGPKINLREELIVNLGNRAVSMSRYEKPITVSSESIVIAVELKPDREEAMLEGMEKLFGTDPEMQFLEHNSHKIWHRKLGEVIEPDLEQYDIFAPGAVSTIPIKLVVTKTDEEKKKEEEEGEPDAPPTFPDGGVAVAKGCIFVSTDREYLKVILDRLDSSEEAAQFTIGDEQEYKTVQRVFSELGMSDKPRFFQFFGRSHETLRPTYEMIRLDQMGQSQAILGKLLNEIFSSDDESGVRRQIIDGSSLPEFEKIQHYFGKVGIYGVTEEHGYFIKGFTLEREVE